MDLQPWSEATAFLENLPDYRKPQICLRYSRLDDFRRKAVKANGNPIIWHECDISIAFLPLGVIRVPNTTSKETIYKTVRTTEVSSDIAISKALKELKEFLLTLEDGQ